jgi:hypothetical protein
MKAIALLFLAALLSSGCSMLGGSRPGKQDLYNPPKIHGPNGVSTEGNAGNKTPTQTDDAGQMAEQVPISDYYRAMKLAQTDYRDDGYAQKKPEYIKNYIDEGIGLVDAYCLRWFQRLNDVQRQIDLKERDINVITQLGTALLGVAKASSDAVALYGAANVAYQGLSGNVRDVFLIAPTSKKIKASVLAMMTEQAALLRRDGGQLNFKQAYTRIEKYADLCTYATAKEVVDGALDKSRASVKDEKIITSFSASAYQRDDAGDRLREFWRPNNKTDTRNEQALKKWMREHGLDGESITFFLRSEMFADARRKAAADLIAP